MLNKNKSTLSESLRLELINSKAISILNLVGLTLAAALEASSMTSLRGFVLYKKEFTYAICDFLLYMRNNT
jgi:hypothetical protein